MMAESGRGVDHGIITVMVLPNLSIKRPPGVSQQAFSIQVRLPAGTAVRW